MTQREQHEHRAPASAWRRFAGPLLLGGAALFALAWQMQHLQDVGGWVVLALAGAWLASQWRQQRAAEQARQEAMAERDHLAGELQSQRQQMLRLQRQRTQILSGVAHSLRQSLWAMRLYTDMLARGTQNAQSHELLQRQLTAIDDANSMLDQFSRLAAIERGQLTVNPAPVELRSLLACVVSDELEQMRPPVPQVRLHGQPVQVRTDPAHLTAVLEALVRHAMEQSSATRGDEARVVLAVRPRGGGRLIDVFDNSAGIAADRLGQVFDPYAPLDATGSTGRQGLTLALAHSLASALGITIEVRSVPQRGTRFRLMLPQHLVLDPAARAADFAPVD